MQPPVAEDSRRAQRAPRQPRARTRTLSPRQAEIGRLVAEGLRNQDIAAHLAIGEQTVKNHLSRAYIKLGLRNRAMLAACVVRGVA